MARTLTADERQDFLQVEIANPAGTFVLFTARPERWLSFDFGEG